jgi:16S rRNA (guanine(966)-N(2))-methyltransferase RsmD
MRVIAGKAKGRNLKYPKGVPTRHLRPLTGQVKEALFNILGVRAAGASFLDLFAGTGSVGIEALSRGAKLVIFVERDRRTVNVIRENLRLTELHDQAEVYSIGVLKAVEILNSKKAKFDIIFIGAPYDDPALEKTLKKLGELNLLREEGTVIAEHRKKHELECEYGVLSKFREARYGDTVLSFYKEMNI